MISRASYKFPTLSPVYYTLPTGSETREAGDLPSTAATRLSVRMRGADMPRLWLLRLAQVPLAHAAPHDCRQYYTTNNGKTTLSLLIQNVY